MDGWMDGGREAFWGFLSLTQPRGILRAATGLYSTLGYSPRLLPKGQLN